MSFKSKIDVKFFQQFLHKSYNSKALIKVTQVLASSVSHRKRKVNFVSPTPASSNDLNKLNLLIKIYFDSFMQNNDQL